jgi:hypothetical protein
MLDAMNLKYIPMSRLLMMLMMTLFLTGCNNDRCDSQNIDAPKVLSSKDGVYFIDGVSVGDHDSLLKYISSIPSGSRITPDYYLERGRYDFDTVQFRKICDDHGVIFLRPLSR